MCPQILMQSGVWVSSDVTQSSVCDTGIQGVGSVHCWIDTALILAACTEYKRGRKMLLGFDAAFAAFHCHD